MLRNRIKRYIRQTITEVKPALPKQADFLVIARKPTRTFTMAAARKNLLHALRLAHLLEAKSKKVEEKSEPDVNEKKS